MRQLHKHDLVLAVVALVLAASTYLYVKDSLRRSQTKTYDASYKLIKLTAKSIPVKVRFASNPPEGYRLISEKVNVAPNRIIVIGPEALLEETTSAETAIIDIGESTKKVVKGVPVESVAGVHLSGEPYVVEVVVPIEKIDVSR